jgi:hypothetical protein
MRTTRARHEAGASSPLHTPQLWQFWGHGSSEPAPAAPAARPAPSARARRASADASPAERTARAGADAASPSVSGQQLADDRRAQLRGRTRTRAALQKLSLTSGHPCAHLPRCRPAGCAAAQDAEAQRRRLRQALSRLTVAELQMKFLTLSAFETTETAHSALVQTVFDLAGACAPRAAGRAAPPSS